MSFFIVWLSNVMIFLLDVKECYEKQHSLLEVYNFVQLSTQHSVNFVSGGKWFENEVVC